MRLKYFKSDHAHQISNYTEYDRYPELFLKCQEVMGKDKAHVILSYGCSTGEEVFTLRGYFPNAHILGVDINHTNIRKAQKQNTHEKNVFSSDIDTSLRQHGPFDMIFALAVLQRTENRNDNIYDSSKIYPFEKFNHKLIELDRHLKPNGLFLIENADYFFEDSDIAVRYTIIKEEPQLFSNRYMYNKNNQKLSSFLPLNRIFLKKDS